MANTKISALTAGAPAQSTDLLPIDRAGANYSLQVSDVLGAITALSNGTTATTQSPFNNSTDLATTAYADLNFKGAGIAGFRDDFFFVQTATVTATAAVIQGDTPWNCRDAGTAGAVTSSISAAASAFPNPGLLTMITPSTSVANEGLCIYKSGGLQPMLGELGLNANWELNFVFHLSTTTNISVRLGVCSTNEQFVDPPTDGMWVEYDSANVSSNTDYTWVTAKSGTNSYSASAVPVDTNFHHVRVRSTQAGTIGFTIDNGTEFTTTAEVTTISELMVFVQLLPRAVSQVTLYLDFVSYVAIPGGVGRY